MGIKASRYEWIVVTEPQCKPMSNQWLKSLATHFSPETDIVLGYSNYIQNKEKFARHIRLDSMFQAMRYLGRAASGHPYMGIGRNLAYRKSLYLSHKGFTTQLNLQRGDDDLFINAVRSILKIPRWLFLPRVLSAFRFHPISECGLKIK